MISSELLIEHIKKRKNCCRIVPQAFFHCLLTCVHNIFSAITGWQLSQIQVLDDLAHFSTCIIDNTKLYTFVSGGDESDNYNGIHDENHYGGNDEKDDKNFKISKC